MTHKIKLKIGENTNDCDVTMDGLPLEVVRVSFDIIAGQKTIVKLEIYSEIEIEGEFEVGVVRYEKELG